MDKIFFHIDVNSAFLSWTAVDRLQHGETVDLRTVPAIIGGDSEQRHGIVLAKSIPAKRYGIETAEPIVSARRKCPDLLVLPSDFKLYSSMSHKLFDYLYSLTSDIEPASIDEGYMDFTPIAHLYESPVAAAGMIRSEVFHRFGFTVNVGISDRKVLAKMASDLEKPDKTHTLFSYEIKDKLWPLPVRDLFLCGRSAAATLNKLDIKTIGDLARTDLSILTSHLKSHGKTLWEFANGIDDSEVVTEERETKGIGNSTTCAHDRTDRDEASRVLYSLAESVADRLHRAGFKTMQVTVEIKYANFRSCSHQTGLAFPIETARSVHEAVMPLFDSLWNKEPIRLLGIRATRLLGADDPVQLSIFDLPTNTSSEAGDLSDSGSLTPAGETSPATDPKDKERDLKLENALREIRGRFGKDSIKRGI